ncbi:MAG: hypothetical protein ABSF26_08265 [Thermoguttaceae bacterium]|jgi:hypothetical protein
MALPCVMIGSLGVSKLIVGGNPLSGISHQSGDADGQMLDYFTVARIKEVLGECERRGINTLLARCDNFIARVIHEYRREGGKMQWIAQSAPERKSLLDNARMAAARGVDAFYVQGAHADEVGRTWTWQEFAEAIRVIRGLGMPAGAGSHTPTFHARRLERGIDLDFACQSLYNITGRTGKIEQHVDLQELFVEEDRIAALEAIAKIPEPVIAYKVLAAGRCDPRKSFQQLAAYLKPKDAVVVGIYNERQANMVAEDVRLAEEYLGGREIDG